MQAPVNNIDEYIAGFPKDIQRILKKIRATIKKAAPKAEEAIRYSMPAFLLNGHLVLFSAYKNHIGLYPVPAGNETFKKEIAPYKSGKGTLHFSFDQPVPYDLIAKLVKLRIEENMMNMDLKKGK